MLQAIQTLAVAAALLVLASGPAAARMLKEAAPAPSPSEGYGYSEESPLIEGGVDVKDVADGFELTPEELALVAAASAPAAAPETAYGFNGRRLLEEAAPAPLPL